MVFVTSFPIKWSWIIAIVLAACHETYLGLGRSEWILDNDDTDRTTADLISTFKYAPVDNSFYLPRDAPVVVTNDFFGLT